MTGIVQTRTAPAPAPQRLERIRFCSRCATTAEEPDSALLPYGFDRVCDRCGMGVMLSTPRNALPPAGAAFVVVARDGQISAVSEPAEPLVGAEAGLVGMPITTAVSSAEDEAQLVRTIARAAGGGRDVTETVVIPAAPESGKRGRMNARIASCGPPRAALVVLERAPL